jgi:hypothetical protein
MFEGFARRASRPRVRRSLSSKAATAHRYSSFKAVRRVMCKPPTDAEHLPHSKSGLITRRSTCKRASSAGPSYPRMPGDKPPRRPEDPGRDTRRQWVGTPKYIGLRRRVERLRRAVAPKSSNIPGVWSLVHVQWGVAP